MKKSIFLFTALLTAGTLGLSAQNSQGQVPPQYPNGGHPHHFQYWVPMGMPQGRNAAVDSKGDFRGQKDSIAFNSKGDFRGLQGGINAMRQAQVAFFNVRIGLTPAEAEKFWPIVDDIRAQRWKINSEIRQLLRTQDEINFEKTNKRIIELKTRDVELERDCYERLRKILSPEKLYRYYQTDEAFYRNMLRDFGGHGKK